MWLVKKWREKFPLTGSSIAAFASVIGLVVPLMVSAERIPLWTIVLVGLSAALMLLYLALVIKTESRARIYSISDKSGIKEYMFQWISTGGRVAVWTRDMSWVDDGDMKRMLRHKAESSELIICLQKEIATSAYFKRYGADVFAYAESLSTVSRFTIVNYGSDGSRVAVGRRKGSLHIIQEYSADEHPVFHMANDLVRLTMDRHHAGEQ